MPATVMQRADPSATKWPDIEPSLDTEVFRQAFRHHPAGVSDYGGGAFLERRPA